MHTVLIIYCLFHRKKVDLQSVWETIQYSVVKFDYNKMLIMLTRHNIVSKYQTMQMATEEWGCSDWQVQTGKCQAVNKKEGSVSFKILNQGFWGHTTVKAELNTATAEQEPTA